MVNPALMCQVPRPSEKGCGGSTVRPAKSEGHEAELHGPLDHPAARNDQNQDRGNGNHRAPVESCASDQESGRKKHRDDGELAGFDTDIETNKGVE